MREHGGKSWEEILATVPRAQLFGPPRPDPTVTHLDSADLIRYGTHPLQSGPSLIVCQNCQEVVMRDACVEQHCLVCAKQRFGKDGLLARVGKSALLQDAVMRAESQITRNPSSRPPRIDTESSASAKDRLQSPASPNSSSSSGSASIPFSSSRVPSANLLRRSSRISVQTIPSK